MVAVQLDEQAIFEVARKLDSREARAAYLRQVCVDDMAIEQRVCALLKAYEESASFLESPATALGTTIDAAFSTECPGARIGPYKLLEQIGEGGFGTVFLAEQAAPVRRTVALKVLKPGMDTRQVVARFEAERQALALMDHPNIARVFDGGATATGRPYFVMELVKGIPITEYCDRNHLTPRQRAELFVSVCQAVQHAHQKGIIHRDLKPSNVLVSRHDTTPIVKVIDFGVAKALGQELTDKTLFTGVAQMIGTPLYMSPEQAGMSDLDVDTRSDIYCLGVLLYELLTGTTPFGKERFRQAGYDEIRRIIREEEPPKPSTRLSESTDTLASISAQRQTEPAKLTRLVRGELDWIVMKALEKDRNRRYETANSFAADVQRYLAGEAVKAVPPSASYRLRKFARRNRAALVMGFVIGGALLTTVVALAVSNWRVHEKQLQTTAALEQTKVEERRKSEQLWRALVAQARGNRLSRRAGQRFETLEIVRQATELAHTLDLPEAKFNELRNTAIGALTLPDLSLTGPWNLWPAEGTAWAFDFDESHARYARTDGQGKCSVRRVADDAELHSLPGLGMAALPYFSRDGRHLAVLHYREGVASVAVQLWDLEQAPAHKIWSEDGGRSVSFHPNGQLLAVTYNDGAIGLFELPSGRQQKRLAPVPPLTREIVVALHPTEPVAAVCSNLDSGVHLRDLNTEKLIAPLPQERRPDSVAWHPDGRTLAVGLEDAKSIRLYDYATRKVLRTLNLDQNASAIAFNKAGDRLASSGWAGTLELFDVNTGQKLFTTMSMPNAQRFSRDDRRLAGAIQDGKLGIWDLADGRECRTLVRNNMPENEAYTHSMSVSPDGRILAAAMVYGFGIWDLARGDQLDFIPTGGSVRVLFEASGSLLVLCETGLFRWPLAKESDAKGQQVMGPPEPLPLPRGGSLGQSRDGRVIVTCARSNSFERPHAGGWILHADRPDPPIRLDPGADMAYIAVSPDGRWVVTVNNTPAGLTRVWDARDGSRIKEFTGRGFAYSQFSPDGNWLYTGLDGGRLVAVADWEPGLKVSGTWGTFSPDSKLLAVATIDGDIRLIEPASGREVATLEVPSQDWASAPFFTPDGTQLIALCGRKVQGIRVWDLRLIRQHLAKMGLDWKAPPYPAADPGSTGIPLKVKVHFGDLALAREQKAKLDIGWLSRALEKNPDDALVCNNLAWVYLTAPEAIRDVNAAVPLAEKAVRLKPGNAAYANTLGVAFYRSGSYREAVGILGKNLVRGENRDLACDLYFLAMSHQKLGETALARVYYDWAVRWPRTDQGLTPEVFQDMDMFRSEATELLGIADKSGVEIAQPPGVKK